MKTALHSLFVLLLLLLSTVGYSQSLMIDGDFKEGTLEQSLQYYCDNNNQLSFSEVQHQVFTPLNSAEISLGFKKTTCWFKFSITNETQAPVNLIFASDFNIFDKLHLFIKFGDGYITKSIGDNIAYNTREIQTRTLAIPFQIAPRSQTDYYLKSYTTSSFYLAPKIKSYPQFIRTSQQINMLIFMTYGIVIGLFLYHLFLVFLTKEKVQLLYILYVGFTLLFFAAEQGSLFQLWPNSPNWNNFSVYSFAFWALSAGTLFCRIFLNTKHNRFIHPFLKWLAVFLALAGAFHFLLSTSIVAMSTSLLALIVIIMLFSIAIKRYLEGFNDAKLFIVAWGLLLVIGATMLIMMNIGSKNISYVLLAAQVSFAAQQILLSLGLAQRINYLKKEKEEKEKEAAIALAENQAKTDFLARMSHEIRTPMNAVIGVAQLLEATPLNDSQQHYIGLLKNSGNLLLGVINDILDYAKITSGNVELEKTPFDLSNILSSTYQILSTSTQNTDINLVFNIEKDVPQWIEGDPIRLQQILFNLLSNAIKFTKQGEIRLQVKRVFQIDKNTVKLQIIISDTGIGLNKEQIKYIFSAFHQADASTTRKYGGTGLGLAISKQLIELMGGSISVNSQLGKGTQFTILVPVLLTQEIPITNPLQPILPWGDFYQLKVLLTEDNAVNQLIISSLLKQIGIEADIASNGEEAFSLVSKASPCYDVVLMDCEMPILNGLEATKQIRTWEQHTQRKAVHIIALTAHALPEYQQRCLDAGMNDYLTKPLLLEQLMVKLLPLVTPKDLV
ncbi:MAG: ATP-binding protein [Agitococcus sp.]